MYGLLHTRRAHLSEFTRAFRRFIDKGPFSIKHPIPSCVPPVFPTMSLQLDDLDYSLPSYQPCNEFEALFGPDDLMPTRPDLPIGSPFSESSPSSSGDDDRGTPFPFERSVRYPLFCNHRTYLCSTVHHSLCCISFYRLSPPPLNVSHGKTSRSFLC